MTSVGTRNMIEMLGPVAEIRRRSQAGKRVEIVDEMRLIVVAAGQGQVGPGDALQALYRSQHLLKTLHPAEQFRCQPNLLGEQLDESPGAEIDLSADIRNT